MSIGSIAEMPIPSREEPGSADEGLQSGFEEEGERGSEEEGELEEVEESPPPPMTAAERIKQMEERSAKARRERKVRLSKLCGNLVVMLIVGAGYGFGDFQRLPPCNQQNPRA